jgi:TfoX/Sxy family transcriptional regulator of competence genes
MAWERPSAELTARFDACLAKAAGVERRQMFGCPCAFVNGNMFCGLHEERIVLRLPEAERAALLAQPSTGPFTVKGRTMREYVVIEKALERSPKEIAAWMRQALNYAQSLPAKSKQTSAAMPASKVKTSKLRKRGRGSVRSKI